jgi:hypothetical protein
LSNSYSKKLTLDQVISIFGFILLVRGYPHFYAIYIGFGFVIISLALLGIVGTGSYTSQSLSGGFIGISVTVFLITGILLAQSRLGEIEANTKSEEQEAQLEAYRECMLADLGGFRAGNVLSNEQIQRLVDVQAEEKK